MATKKTTNRKRGLELSRGGMKKKSLLIISVAVVVAAALLAILFNTVLGNHQPVIASLEARPTRVLPSGSCQLVVTASDSDGDELSYDWLATGGQIDGQGAVVTWTAPDSGGFYHVTLTVTDGGGGQATKEVTITVRANEPPYIDSLIAGADWTTPLGSLQITCNATDPDGDELSYEWSASGGSITGTGAVADWTAPGEVGMYNVTVAVTDSHGGEDTGSIALSVATSTPPTVEDLIVTADHKYLKETAGGYKVGKTQEFHIASIVSNTSGELAYEWSCTDGQISGEGSTITWTAPDVSDVSLEVTVTVMVTDVAGNRVTKSIVLDVVSCSACTFG